MKTISCKELGGACYQKFSANTFEEIAELSKEHGKKMFQKKDAEHLNAMQQMRSLVKDTDGMKKWYEERKKVFDSLPED